MKIEDLLAENQLLKQQIIVLQEQIKVLQKLVFGKKSERFIEDSADQYLFKFETDLDNQPQEEIVSVPAHKKRKAKSTPINTISYPDDLPVETTVLDLKDEEKIDLTSGKPLVKIGEEITKRLAVKPNQFFIKQIVSV
jgi:hypothetical protein